MPRREQCFVTIQTGPWRGPGSWLHRVYCYPCDWQEIIDEGGYDAARDARARHDAGEGVKAVKPKKKVSKAAAKKRVAARRRQQEQEWEVFF